MENTTATAEVAFLASGGGSFGQHHLICLTHQRGRLIEVTCIARPVPSRMRGGLEVSRPAGLCPCRFLGLAEQVRAADALPTLHADPDHC